MAEAAPVSNGLKRAREIGARIQTEKQASATIVQVIQTLRRAVDLLGSFSFADKATGFQAAYASRMEQQIDRVRVLQNQLAIGFDRALADKIGLAVVQSAGLLRDVKRDVAKSQAEGAFTALAEDFARAMREILEGAARIAAQAIPWWLWAAAAYVLLRDDD